VTKIEVLYFAEYKLLFNKDLHMGPLKNSTINSGVIHCSSVR